MGLKPLLRLGGSRHLRLSMGGRLRARLLQLLLQVRLALRQLSAHAFAVRLRRTPAQGTPPVAGALRLACLPWLGGTSCWGGKCLRALGMSSTICLTRTTALVFTE